MRKKGIKIKNPLKEFLDKYAVKSKKDSTTNSFGEDITHLDEDGELPWGWTYANLNFINKMTSERGYFFEKWQNSCTLSPKEELASLKSYLLCLENLKKLCTAKGECFEKWYHDIIADEEYFNRWYSHLNYLEENLITLEKDYWDRLDFCDGLRNRILDVLKENEGILQKDIYKLFDTRFKSCVSDELYHMDKEKVVIRIKQGNTYILKTIH